MLMYAYRCIKDQRNRNWGSNKKKKFKVGDWIDCSGYPTKKLEKAYIFAGKAHKNPEVLTSYFELVAFHLTEIEVCA